MILVDTSVWADHIRGRDARLFALLSSNLVLMHPFVIGELALGNLSDRAATLSLMRRLPRCPIASDEEVLTLIERVPLAGSGIGYVDAHLLASTTLSSIQALWTRDRRLHSAAERLGVADAG